MYLVFGGRKSAVPNTFESRERRFRSDWEGVARLIENDGPVSPISLQLVKLGVSRMKLYYLRNNQQSPLISYRGPAGTKQYIRFWVISATNRGKGTSRQW